MIGYNVKVINIMEKYNIKVIKWWRKEVIDILVEDWVEGVDAESLLEYYVGDYRDYLENCSDEELREYLEEISCQL